jgi:DNA ligase-1
LARSPERDDVVKLAQLAEASAAVAATRSRKKKIAHLATALRGLSPDELEAGVAFLSGEIRHGRIGLGWAAVSEVTAAPAPEPRLTVAQADDALADIKAIKGKGSTTRKRESLAALLALSTEAEQRFLRGLVIGELRQGALEGVMVEAIAEASDVDAALVRRASMLAGDQREVARAALTEGAASLSRFSLELFRPLQPMLAQTADGVGDALARTAGCALEHKLDGARVQVHKRADEVRVYTRNLNDVTARVPEIVEGVRALPATSLVLDGEVLALRDDGRPLPFQTTMRRFGRKLDVERMRHELPLSVRFFDVLHRDGEDVLDLATGERLTVLDEVVPQASRVPRIVPADEDEAEAFFAAALEAGQEGLVAKALDSAYEAGRRGAGWLKIKPAHTLDLVVLAAEWGSGRRRGFLSNLHLGARDPEGGAFVMLGKTFKGLTDERLRWQTERLQQLELTRDDYTVFVRPELVVEIAFDGVQTSPHYPAGLALRFARVKGFRPDKPASEADTIDTVRAIHDKGHGPR